MKNVGIICEYNPFHNGHKYQLEKARELSGADNVICIMSGSFMQRGEPAAWDKWSRAEMAIRNGADLVIELPVVYASQAAEYFATGAIKILNQMKIVDSLCFGSETGSLETMYEIAKVLSVESDDLKASIKSKLSEGLVFPKAYQLAVLDYLKTGSLSKKLDNHEVHALLSSPNNILGLEYLKALFLSESKIEPFTIKRKGSEYNDTEIMNTLASATAIRKEVQTSGFSDRLINALPEASLEIIKATEQTINWEDFKELLFYKLRTTDIEEIKKFAYISEGIENRILKALLHVDTVDGLIDRVKTKRFTRTAIQRMLISILLGINKEDLIQFKNQSTPSYIRVLALNESGGRILRKMQKLEVENVITKFASYKSDNVDINRMLTLDIRATEVYFSAKEEKLKKKLESNQFVKQSLKKPGLVDFLQSPIIIKST